VRNIFKYYVAYKLTLEAQEATRKARQQIEAPKKYNGRSHPAARYFLAWLLCDLPALVGIELRRFLSGGLRLRDRGPFRITTPSWLTMKVITPEFP
jgi:hypothetical protein